MVMLSPDLRERAKSADASLQQRMCFRLLGERAEDEWLERQTGAERRAEIHLVIAEQTRPESPVGGETHAVAAAAVRMRHRGDHADRSTRSLEARVRRGTVATRWSLRGSERTECL